MTFGSNDGSFDVKALSLDLVKSRLSFAEPSLWEKASVRAEPGRAYLQGATEPSLRRAYKLDWTGLSEPSLGNELKRAEPNRAYYTSRAMSMQAYLS